MIAFPNPIPELNNSSDVIANYIRVVVQGNASCQLSSPWKRSSTSPTVTLSAEIITINGKPINNSKIQTMPYLLAQVILFQPGD